VSAHDEITDLAISRLDEGERAAKARVAAAVGLCKLTSVAPELYSASFQPLSLYSIQCVCEREREITKLARRREMKD
jgi:hypothetical protein